MHSHTTALILHELESRLRDLELERFAEIGLRPASLRPRFFRREVKPLAATVEVVRPVARDGTSLSRAA